MLADTQMHDRNAHMYVNIADANLCTQMQTDVNSRC